MSYIVHLPNGAIETFQGMELAIAKYPAAVRANTTASQDIHIWLPQHQNDVAWGYPAQTCVINKTQSNYLYGVTQKGENIG